jgi:FKBP-type peptidyl-prolyl cis-trans isomerase (trigger factor)
VDSDEELFKRMRLDSVDALKDMVKKAISRQKSAAKKNENAAAVYNMISAKVGEIPLPRSLTMKEAEREMRAMLREKVKSEEDLKGFKENQAAILEEAKKTAEQRVRKYIILRKIAKQENITVEGSEMSAQLRQMSKYFGAKEKDLRHAMSQNGGMDELHADMLCGKVLDFLLEKADTGAKQ